MNLRFTNIFGAIQSIFIALGLLAGGISARAATLNVPAQYPTIQAAVTAAAVGDTVLVANGTYTGAGNYAIDFGGKDLTVKSSGGSAACIIDCQQKGRAFYFHSSETSASRVDGFTLKNGKVFATDSSGAGGGVCAASGNPTVANCAFVSNAAYYYHNNYNDPFVTGNVGSGGGMAGGTAVNCVFTGNSARLGGGMTNGTAINCLFTGNTALPSGGTAEIGGDGGGMAGGTAINCVFTGNSALNPGGIFVNSSLGGGMYGGAAIHCVFSGNTAADHGGKFGKPLTPAGSAMYGGTAVNCILWNNTAAALPIAVSVTMTYSDVQGGATGVGNISADPLFVNAAAGNFHLMANSPCINAGTATALPSGVTLPATDFDGNSRIVGSAPDMGAFEYGTIALAKRNLIWQNSVTGDSVYWQMTGSQQTDGGTLSTGVPANWKIVAYAAITGDGQPDILWQDSLTGDVVYWQMNGTQRVGGGYLSQGVPNTWRVAAVADITGDGKNDLLWQNRDTGEVVYWEMNGIQRVSGGYITQTVPPVWQIVAAGDITGDGKTDLIWQNSDNGDVVYWQMNGVQRVDGGYLSQGNGTLWRIAALCDVTGDKQNDLIWQNTASGAVKYWQMSGATYSGTSGYMAQNVGSVWRVIGLN